MRLTRQHVMTQMTEFHCVEFEKCFFFLNYCSYRLYTNEVNSTVCDDTNDCVESENVVTTVTVIDYKDL